MSRAWPRLALFAFLALLVSGPAHAYRFGTDETIHKIEDVKLKGAKDEDLFLGYMTRIRYFLAGLYVEDVGYVLGVEGDSKRFYHMPEGEELKSFQRSGYLPDPLPPYKLSIFDYIIGYSLWWALAIGAFFVWFGNRRKRAAAAAAAPEPPPAPEAAPAPEKPGAPPPSS
ncbi:hypothetical protein [Enterovirga sp.]|uniref:hypothetical protein n=1 Tax=Enterovirga sp. TaxID=2026350 RepID=UPI002BEE2835|nr:hypothetical protein [Enterovirga sp.]HMO27745.1 hypothetical protein [Enterovirga sp.]